LRVSVVLDQEMVPEMVPEMVLVLVPGMVLVLDHSMFYL
jgi:hypothetical protein